MIVFEDEASFRQTPTLHATWARVASQPQVPTRGERNTQKIFGAVRLDTAQFIYLHQQDYFQWETYVAFLDQVLVPAFYRRGHRVFLIVLARTQCHRKDLELHTQTRHPQPLLRTACTPLPRSIPHVPPRAAPPRGNCQSDAPILLIIMSNYLCADI